MPTLRTSSACVTEYEPSWTAGMPVHPEPSLHNRGTRLPRREAWDLVILTAISISSAGLIILPFSGVAPAVQPAALHARDLRVDARLSPAMLPIAVAPAPRRGSRRDLGMRETPSRDARREEPRPLPAKLGRMLVGNGRHRVRPFPRPADFK